MQTTEQAAAIAAGTVPEMTKTPFKSQDRVTYEKLQTEFKSLTKASADTIIKRAKILYEAKKELGGNKITFTFDEFCADLGYPRRETKDKDGKTKFVEHSTVRKFVAIGEKAARFHDVLDRMPQEWTTIEKLALLDKADFELVKKDDRFNPQMKSKDIDTILGKASTVSEYEHITFKIKLVKLDDAKKLEILTALEAIPGVELSNTNRDKLKVAA